MAELLRITPQDNVAVALTALSSGQNVTVDGIALTTVTDVPAGHKVALFPIKAGEKVIKYGFPIGYAKEDIPVGAHVHVHNLHTGLSGELTYEYHPTYPTIPEIPAATFMGYPRKDGRVGVRNELWILPAVGCVNDVARQLERAAQELVGGGVECVCAFPHPYGCSQMGDDQENTRTILADLATHPNVGGVLVLGLGNRRMTADALGDRVVSGILVTRHMQEERLRSVCAVAPGVLGITGVETAELALGLAERVKPSAVIVVDALAAMETNHIGTTIQLTDTGIRPGSGVGNHRKGITAETMHVPVIAVGIPLVVYASTIVRDALADMMQRESGDAQALAEQLTSGYPRDFVVTPRNIDELVAGLADLLALAINSALQTNLEMEELSHCLH